MKRTRLIFFLVLAVCLVILSLSVARQLLNAAALLPVFVICTVFGGGVVLLDFAGVLGHHVDDALAGLGGHSLAGGGHDFGGHGGDGGHDLAGGQAPHVAGVTHAAAEAGPAQPAEGAVHAAAEAGHAQPAAEASASGHHPAEANESRDNGSAAGHVAGEQGHPVTAGHLPAHPAVVARAGPDATPVLSLLAYLRLLVYFCLGFGPAGWIALASGEGPLVSLGIAVPFGLASLWLARAFFRFQRRDTGAVPPETDLLREEAQVLVPLDHTTMGKVRVRAGMTVADLYALAADPGAAFKDGDTVRVVSVTDECVYVR